MKLVLTFQLIGTFLAFLVTVVPLFYPSYYRKRAQQGMNTLDEFTESVEVDTDEDHGDGTLSISWLTKSDTGFKKVGKAIENEAGLSREIWFEGLPDSIERIGIAKGSIYAIADYFEIESEDMRYGAWPNYALFVRGVDENERIVAYDRNRPRTTRRHTQLRTWVRTVSNRRSQYVTGTLAILWTTTSIGTVVLV